MHLLRTMSGLWRNINERVVWQCKEIQQRNIHTFSKLKCWPAKKRKKKQESDAVGYLYFVVGVMSEISQVQ